MLPFLEKSLSSLVFSGEGTTSLLAIWHQSSKTADQVTPTAGPSLFRLSSFSPPLSLDFTLKLCFVQNAFRLTCKRNKQKKQDLSGVLLSKRCLIHWVLKVRDEGCGAVIQKIWLTPDVMHVTRLRIYVEFYSAMHSEFLVYVMVLTLVTCMPGHRYTCRETSFLHSFMLCNIFCCPILVSLCELKPQCCILFWQERHSVWSSVASPYALDFNVLCVYRCSFACHSCYLS